MKNTKTTSHMRNNYLYSNIAVLHPSGYLMCYVSRKKATWYLERKLAEVVSENPLKLQLLFKPRGNGNVDDPYGLMVKENRCVVCGIQYNLTKHHIIPYCYRQYFPKEYKEYQSHDVVLLCTKCHRRTTSWL
jgi:hypothetical protein